MIPVQTAPEYFKVRQVIQKFPVRGKCGTCFRSQHLRVRSAQTHGIKITPGSFFFLQSEPVASWMIGGTEIYIIPHDNHIPNRKVTDLLPSAAMRISPVKPASITDIRKKDISVPYINLPRYLVRQHFHLLPGPLAAAQGIIGLAAEIVIPVIICHTVSLPSVLKAFIKPFPFRSVGILCPIPFHAFQNASPFFPICGILRFAFHAPNPGFIPCACRISNVNGIRPIPVRSPATGKPKPQTYCRKAPQNVFPWIFPVYRFFTNYFPANYFSAFCLFFHFYTPCPLPRTQNQ